MNRIDEVVVFQSLQKPQVAEIARIQLAYLQQRLQEKNLSISLTDQALLKLVDLGYETSIWGQTFKKGRFSSGWKIL